MHIPDGFINLPTAAITSVASAGGVGYSLRVARTKLQDRQIPLVGVTAAFVFAAQMINFPVLPGVSGHLLGGALAAILLGPWMGCLVLATVLLVQAIGFADGGITALGANVSLLSLVSAVGGYYLFRALTAVMPRTRHGFLAATAMTSWATVVGASVLASAYISYGGFAGAEQAGLVFPVMIGVHALIGIGEAFITTAVVGAVLQARPDLGANADRLDAAALGSRRHSLRTVAVAGVGVALVVAMGLSYFASAAPDGLEASVLQTTCADAADPDACLAQAAGDPVFEAAPLRDYSVVWLSGLVGVLACLGLAWGVARATRRKRSAPAATPRERETTPA